MEKIESLDRYLFLLINGAHNHFFDTLMSITSETLPWIPVFLLLLIFIKKGFTWKAFSLTLLSIVFLIFVTDRLSVILFKDVFLRYRPCHNLDLQSLIHLVDGHCGGTYGFVSSHSANFFGIFSFFIFLKKPKNILLILFISAPILVAYSRIYLGVHYPLDVIAGGVLGVGVSFLVHRIFLGSLLRKFE